MKKLYSDKVGIEFEHVNSREEKEWLYNRFDELMSEELSNFEKYFINDLLLKSEVFDHFLTVNKPSFKRYSIEGEESLLILLAKLFAVSSENGVEEVVFGLPHRGRLNILCQLLDFPVRDFFQKLTKNCELTEDFNTFIDDIAMHIAVCTRKKFQSKFNTHYFDF